MAPTCTPDKKNDYENQRLGSNELYFTTNEFNNVSRNDSIGTDSETRESHQMNRLLTMFPALDTYFDLIKKVGHGTFSTVYLATIKGDRNKKFAVKHVVPTCHPDRVKFELQCLKDLGGTDNIVGVDLSFRYLNSVIFIMPYQAHDYFGDYVNKMDSLEVAQYMKNLLKAIARVHNFNIVHRDIKPSNFLYDRRNRKYLLVDFGLAHAVTAPSNPEVGNKRKRSDVSLTQENPNKKINLNPPQSGSSQKENDMSLKLKAATRQLSFMATGSSKQTVKTAPCVTLTISPPIKSAETQNNGKCDCYGKPRTCDICTARKNLRALRAGTPGFRPPEVLLKSFHQDTAIDIWAAGVIMLSILSGSCNFFASPDDMTALAEIIIIFGLNPIRKIANLCGRHLICSEKCPPLDLRKICRILKARDKLMRFFETEDMCEKCNQLKVLCVCIGTSLTKNIPDLFPNEAYDLLNKLLDVNPKTRISAENALKHPFLSNA